MMVKLEQSEYILTRFLKWVQFFLSFFDIWRCCPSVRFNSLLTQGLAGIQPVDVPGIENVRRFLLKYGYLEMYDFSLTPIVVLTGWRNWSYWGSLFLPMEKPQYPRTAWARYILPCFQPKNHQIISIRYTFLLTYQRKHEHSICFTYQRKHENSIFFTYQRKHEHSTIGGCVFA